jgi:hypothetical protein
MTWTRAVGAKAGEFFENPGVWYTESGLNRRYKQESDL